MNTQRVMFATLSAVLVASSLLSVGCSEAHSQPPPATTSAGVPVRVVLVERTTLERSVRAVGRLAHKRSLALGFKNGGTIRQLLVQEGATVRRGQRLAVVDQTEIDAQVAQSRASVDKADRDLARVDKLSATQAASRNDADNARTAADLAHAALAAALYNQTASVLVAPEDGRIDKRLAEVGEQAAPGRPIYSMSGNASGFVVRAGVVDRDLPGLKIGDAAEVKVDALPGRTWKAEVSEIATLPSQQSGTYEIELRVTIAPDSPPLIAGMTAKVALPRSTGAPQPVIPLGALIDANGLHCALYVLVDDAAGTTVRRVPVELGYIVGDRATVASGLAGGERVVSEGASFIEPGRRVRAISADVR